MSVFLFTPIPSNAGVIPVQVLNMTGNTQGELITVNIGSFINVTTVAGFYNAILTVPDAPIWTGTTRALDSVPRRQQYMNITITAAIPFTN